MNKRSVMDVVLQCRHIANDCERYKAICSELTNEELEELSHSSFYDNKLKQAAAVELAERLLLE